VLAAYRGYPPGDVFTGMPADVRRHHAALTPAELATGPSSPTAPGWPPALAVPPALLLGPVETGFQLLDEARVLPGMQRRGPHPRARVLLQLLHLAAETLIHDEAGAARADPVQRLHPHLFIRRPKLREQHARIGTGGSAPTALALSRGRTVTPAMRPAPRISLRLARNAFGSR